VPVASPSPNQYDQAGNLLTSTDGANDVTTRTFDAAGQVLTEQVAKAGIIASLVTVTTAPWSPPVA
jgi:YD repeat-containing protein